MFNKESITNNYSSGFSGKCLFCLNCISHDEIRWQTDESTVICPHCFVDSVVDTTTISELAFKNERIRRFGEINTFSNNELLSTYKESNTRVTNQNSILREPTNVVPNTEVRTFDGIMVVLRI